MHGQTREKLIIANWKSHKTSAEAMAWIEIVGPAASSSPHQLILCPPFPFLPTLHWNITSKGQKITLGVQDLSPFPAGAYTGAVSSHNLEELGVVYAILGHSERRKYFHETAQEIANKATQALSSKITPIICVDKEHILAQANALTDEDRNQCIVAYEPVGHIGTGEVDPIEDVLAVAKDIRKAFSEDTPVIYGGSIDENNGHLYIDHPELQGVLVGSMSLDAQRFLSLSSARK